LRRPKRADIPALCRLVNDPVIAVNTARIRYPYPPSSARCWFAAIGNSRNGGFDIPYLMALRSNPRLFAGAAGFSIRPGRAPEIGYWLARDHRGRGYASEAARRLVEFLFDNGAEAVGANARTTNIASQRVLQAAGMRRLTGRGRIKSLQLGRYVPVVLFRVERNDWEERG
jgi:RimJ/RimL family protein N-acetyltransferase